jgi:hypothetical protein
MKIAGPTAGVSLLQGSPLDAFPHDLVARAEGQGRNTGGRPLVFKSVEQAKNYEVTPINQIPVERYVVYWKLRKQGISHGKTNSA